MTELENIPVIKFPSGSLASRKSAVPYRDQLDRYLANGALRVNIDLEETEFISGSFADESIACLILKYGFEKVVNTIKLIHANDFCKNGIAKALLERKNELLAQNKSKVLVG